MGSGQSVYTFSVSCSEKETFEHGVGPKVTHILSAMILKGIPFIYFLSWKRSKAYVS